MLVDEKCPMCGTLNKDLNLEETNGWFECQKCGNTIQLLQYQKAVKIPVFNSLKDVEKYYANRTLKNNK